MAGPAALIIGLSLGVAAPASAARPPAQDHGGASLQAALAEPGGLAAKAGPDGRVLFAPRDNAIVNSAFESDSCVPSQNSAPYECEAVGFYYDGFGSAGLAANSNGGAWTSGDNIGTPPAPNAVTLPGEVSCAEVVSELPDCLAVGVHYSGNGSDVQFAAWGDANFLQVVQGRNPRGDTWSAMDDVSCPSSTFCMVVGAAGRKGTSHATAYTWNGRALRALSVPAPRRSHDVELGGLSCATTENCVAVGNYKDPAGRFLTYAAIWTSGKWKLEVTPNAPGQTTTVFNAVSCATATSCLADGYSLRRTTAEIHTFAASWNGARWQLVRTPSRADSGFAGVSCPATGTCFAVGWYKTAGLIERWNGRGWTILKTARPTGAANVYEFLHVSCVSADSCAAVGWHWGRRVLNRTLAERWNGKTWTLQSSVNN